MLNKGGLNMTLKEVLHRRDDALMEILDRLKGKKLYNNLCVQLKFFGKTLKGKYIVLHLWKPADGDDLPEIDREVITILDNGKVVFAHRPPEYWDGKDIDTGKVTRHYPKTYDKGGWNIPNVKYWLDCLLPNMEED